MTQTKKEAEINNSAFANVENVTDAVRTFSYGDLLTLRAVTKDLIRKQTREHFKRIKTLKRGF